MGIDFVGAESPRSGAETAPLRRQNQIRRRTQIFAHTSPRKSCEDLRLIRCPISGSDQDRLTAGSHSGLDICKLVTDHPGTCQVDTVIASRLQQHSGKPFAAVTIDLVLILPLRGMVRADVEAVDNNISPPELLLEMFMQSTYGFTRKVAARHPGLVGDDDQQKSGTLEPVQGVGNTRDETEVFDAMQVVLLDVDRTVAVEKYGSLRTFVHCDTMFNLGMPAKFYQ